MEFLPPSKESETSPKADQSGIALFMVLAAITLLSVLVTEFTYVAQVNQRMAYDNVDQLKAHYVAKAGFKLSLLRLKAYRTVSAYLSKNSGGASPPVPKQLVEKIWNFPFVFPFPSDLPGMTSADKDRIEKFQKSTTIKGSFSASIESESSKYNLNLVLSKFVPAKEEEKKKGNDTSGKDPNTPPQDDIADTSTKKPEETKEEVFDAEGARRYLKDYLIQIFNTRAEVDKDFQDLYKNFRPDELGEEIIAWADKTYEPSYKPDSLIAVKRAPFYHLSELYMLVNMDDALFELYSPSFTVNRTPGINVNTMNAHILRIIASNIKEDEVKEFFKTRDDPNKDGSFKNPDDFFTYLKTNVSSFGGDDKKIEELKKDLDKRNIRIITDESEFKITVNAQVNNASRRLEAWVSLSSAPSEPPKGAQPVDAIPAPLPQAPGAADSGLKVTFMRFL